MAVVSPDESWSAGEQFSLIVTENTALGSEFLNQIPDGILLYADTLEQCLQALADHQAAATVCDSYTLNYYNWKPGISDLRDDYPLEFPSLQPCFAASSKLDPMLMKANADLAASLALALILGVTLLVYRRRKQTEEQIQKRRTEMFQHKAEVDRISGLYN